MTTISIDERARIRGPHKGRPEHGWFRRHLHYPAAYTWLVFVASMDIMMTWVILHSGGREVNPLAEAVIHRFDLPGIVAFKFVLVAVIILISEVVGTRRPAVGRWFAAAAVLVSCVPVVLAFYLLLTGGTGPADPS